MKVQLYTTLLLLTGILPVSVSAQQKIKRTEPAPLVFYDTHWNVCYPEQAIWFRPVLEKEDDKYPFIGYYMTGQKYIYGIYSSLDSGGIRDGYFLFYDTLGFVTKEGLFSKNRQTGVWKIYHRRSEKVRQEKVYGKNERTWTFRDYDTSGNLTREGMYIDNQKSGLWKQYRTGTGELWCEQQFEKNAPIWLTSYYPGGLIKRREKYKRDDKQPVPSVPYGACYDTDGREIPFTPFAIEPEFPGGLPAMTKFLRKNIVYPPICSDNYIEGRVLVVFTIRADGVIKDPHVPESIHPLLDREALNAVRLMPPWKPGIRDDRPDDYRFTLPVIFRLE